MTPSDTSTLTKTSSNAQKPCQVLLIEDDNYLRDLLAHKLLQENIVTEIAINGTEALEKINKLMPKVIILDLILPDMDGFNILSIIKKQTATKNIKVIILSNLGQKDEIEQCLGLGAVDYLIKANYTPKEIVEKVKTYL